MAAHDEKGLSVGGSGRPRPRCPASVVALDPYARDRRVKQAAIPITGLDHHGDPHAALHREPVNRVVRVRRFGGSRVGRHGGRWCNASATRSQRPTGSAPHGRRRSRVRRMGKPEPFGRMGKPEPFGCPARSSPRSPAARRPRNSGRLLELAARTGRQAARLAKQRRQRRVSTSRVLVSGPWHFSQRRSRIVRWCDRQAFVVGFSAWRVQPSHTHLPNVMDAPLGAGRSRAPRASSRVPTQAAMAMPQARRARTGRSRDRTITAWYFLAEFGV